jgi:predicted MFS family arabinose efflux permease
MFPGEGQVTPMRALFILGGGLGFLSVLIGWRYMHEPSASVARKELPHFDLYRVPAFLTEKLRYMPHRLMYIVEISSRNLSPRNFSWNLKRYYVVVFLAFTGFLSFYVALPIFLSQYVGITSAQVFAVYLASSLVSLMFYTSAGKLVDRFGGRRVQGTAFGLRVLIFPSFFLVTLFPLDLGTLFLLMCLLNGLAGLCWALLAVAGDALVAGMSHREFRSQSMGAYNSVRGVSTIVGSLLGGLVGQYFGYLVLFVMASAFVAVSFAMLMTTKVHRDDAEDAGAGRAVP